MKKNVLFLASVLFSILLFASCSKDEDESKFSPIGYTYSSYDPVYSIFMGIDMYENLTFINETQVKRSILKRSSTGAPFGSSDIYTYKLSYPSLSIYDTDGELRKQCTFITEKDIDWGDYQYRRLD